MKYEEGNQGELDVSINGKNIRFYSDGFGNIKVYGPNIDAFGNCFYEQINSGLDLIEELVVASAQLALKENFLEELEKSL